MGPICALWDCFRPAQGSKWCQDYCSSCHSMLAINEGLPAMIKKEEEAIPTLVIQAEKWRNEYEEGMVAVEQKNRKKMFLKEKEIAIDISTKKHRRLRSKKEKNQPEKNLLEKRRQKKRKGKHRHPIARPKKKTQEMRTTYQKRLRQPKKKVFDAFLAPGSELWMFNDVPENEREKKLTDGDLDINRLENISLGDREGNAVIRRHLESLPLESFNSISIFDSILILADESVKDSAIQANSRSLATLLLIRDIQAKRLPVRVAKSIAHRGGFLQGSSIGEIQQASDKSIIISEILDPRTKKLFSMLKISDYVLSKKKERNRKEIEIFWARNICTIFAEKKSKSFLHRISRLRLLQAIKFVGTTADLADRQRFCHGCDGSVRREEIALSLKFCSCEK